MSSVTAFRCVVSSKENTDCPKVVQQKAVLQLKTEAILVDLKGIAGRLQTKSSKHAEASPLKIH